MNYRVFAAALLFGGARVLWRHMAAAVTLSASAFQWGGGGLRYNHGGHRARHHGWCRNGSRAMARDPRADGCFLEAPGFQGHMKRKLWPSGAHPCCQTSNNPSGTGVPELADEPNTVNSARNARDLFGPFQVPNQKPARSRRSYLGERAQGKYANRPPHAAPHHGHGLPSRPRLGRDLGEAAPPRP